MRRQFDSTKADGGDIVARDDKDSAGRNITCAWGGCTARASVYFEGSHGYCVYHRWKDHIPAPERLKPPHDFSEFGRKAWAHRLKWRELAGERLTDAQRRAWPEALGEERAKWIEVEENDS